MNENLKKRFDYFRRIFRAYFLKKPSYVSFWREKPEISPNITPDKIGPYYMAFAEKADYKGPKDQNGVIVLDYLSGIGRQYNPLAIAQYGLAHWNIYLKTKEPKNFETAKIQADWLVENLEKNDFGLMVWKHHFFWRYKQDLKPGWFSSHAQGTGISLLLRVYGETKEEKYLNAAKSAFIPLNAEIKNGGVKHIDGKGGVWLEEYPVNPPTNILNGFIWALWGVYDYRLFFKDNDSKKLWDDCVRTIKENLPRFDAGFWSLYDLSKQGMKMLASPFYHSLHIIQLEIMGILTGDEFFKRWAERWSGYRNVFWKRGFALAYKAIFKLLYF
jgi:hypothetical protein